MPIVKAHDTYYYCDDVNLKSILYINPQTTHSGKDPCPLGMDFESEGATIHLSGIGELILFTETGKIVYLVDTYKTYAQSDTDTPIIYLINILPNKTYNDTIYLYDNSMVELLVSKVVSKVKINVQSPQVIHKYITLSILVDVVKNMGIFGYFKVKYNNATNEITVNHNTMLTQPTQQKILRSVKSDTSIDYNSSAASIASVVSGAQTSGFHPNNNKNGYVGSIVPPKRTASKSRNPFKLFLV
jgi:hypothetical protein